MRAGGRRLALYVETMPGLRLSYWHPRLLRTVFFELQQQQEAGLFCDVTLQGDGVGIHVHSCVIAACSPFLAKLLMCPTEISKVSDSRRTTLSNRRVLRIHGIKSLHLFPLVHYMYTSELEVSPGDVSGVLKAAQKLQIPEVELLKLEGGRLVRAESGKRLNRNCLGSKTHTCYAKDENQEIIKSYTHTKINPTSNYQSKIEKDVTSVSFLDIQQSNENSSDSETIGCSISSNLGSLENVIRCGSSLEDLVNSHLDNVPSSHDFLQQALDTQISQERALPSHNSIEDVAKRQDLITNAVISQNFVQDFISNENSPIDVARKVDLMECKIKNALNYVPSCQSEQSVNVLLNNVQVSQDSLDNAESSQFAKNVQNIAELLQNEKKSKRLPENVQSIEELLENMQSSNILPENTQNIVELPVDVWNSRELPVDVQSNGELPVNSPRGQDTHENLLKRCRTSRKQKKGKSEAMPSQERKGFVEGQQLTCTKSRKRLLKKIRLDTKSDEIASVDTECLKCKSPDINCNNEISVSDKFEKHDIFNLRNSLSPNPSSVNQLSQQCDKSRFYHWHNLRHTVEFSEQLPLETTIQEDVKHLERCKLGTEKMMLYNNERADEALIVSSEVTDLPASDVDNSVLHTSLESLKEACSGLIKEMQIGTIAYVGLKSNAHCDTHGTAIQEDLTSSTFCEHETSEVYAYNKGLDESKKSQHNLDDSFETEGEKVKLRNANSGLSCEVVRKVESSNIVCPSKGQEHLKAFEEQVELNITTSVSPDVDVGVYSPYTFLEEPVWPDLSSDSDIEIDILG